MAIANHFYNQTTRKYVALFGTIFNQLKIERRNNAGTAVQSIIVPLSYAPFQKILSRVTEDPDLLNSTRGAISLPRMSFEITNIFYDPARKVASTRKMRKEAKAESESSRNFLYSSVPYNIDFSLYIMTKYSEDATQLMEQILPFFTPDWTVTARMVPDLDPIDIPIILNSVTTEDLYEGDYTERQSILYTLNFTLKGYYFGPEKQRKVIKFVETYFATTTTANAEFEERLTVRPGLDSEGNPVTQEGVGATAVTTVTNGQVSDITVINNGQNYNANNVISAVIEAPVTSTAVATANIANTSISSFDISSGGGYYSSVPAVTISLPDSTPVQATASITVSNNSIDTITITNSGTFYNSANVSISEPPALSQYVKFGTDALYHSSATDSLLAHTMVGNLVTAGGGFAIEFWIYPTSFPSTGVKNILHVDGTSMRIEIEDDGEIVYRPVLNSAPVRSTPEVLTLNTWNHVRLEHVGSNARWLVNGVVDAGSGAPAGFLVGGGTDIYIGQRGSTDSFEGAIDNLIIDQIVTQTPVGSYTIPTTPATGSELTANYDKDIATADAIIADGEVANIIITNVGSNYANTTPTVTISAPNAVPADFAASVTAVLTNGSVTDITINDGGKFYQTANVEIDAPTATTATANVQIDSHGDVSGLTIINPGAGYTSSPAITIDPPQYGSIPYQDIEFDDDWGIITIIEDV